MYMYIFPPSLDISTLNCLFKVQKKVKPSAKMAVVVGKEAQLIFIIQGFN